MNQKLLVWFADVDREDISLVGGKGANVGEMTKAGFPVPPGFIVTSIAYREFLKENNLEIKIKHLLGTIDYSNPKTLENASRAIMHEIEKGKMSQALIQEIFSAYSKLGGALKDALVAVVSSQTHEDLSSTSFAKQQETYLNVKGDANLILKIKEAWASLFDAQAIFYRHAQKIDHMKVAIAISVQKMVQSDVSGIIFTLSPYNNDKTAMAIEAIYGVGEDLVQGKLAPDRYEVDKATLIIKNKHLEKQTHMLTKRGTENKEVPVTKNLQGKQKISDAEILQLAELGKKLEHHYFFPQEVKWAIEKGVVYLIQTKPLTNIKEVSEKQEPDKATVHKNTLLKGSPASPGIVTGPVKLLESTRDIDTVKFGDILVVHQTSPDFVPAMKRAIAIIVTDQAGLTSHAVIVAQESGIPAVVGTERATKRLRNGDIVTVNGITGEVSEGGYQVEQKETHEKVALQTATKLYLHLVEPEFAQKIAQRHVDGVGLLEAEYMIAQRGEHPKKILRNGKKEEFVTSLADNLEKFCSAFSPRPVVYRASDFTSNEYRALQGGDRFESIESNPALGYRGAFRAIHDPEIFELELEAIKRVRNKKGFRNLWLMLPFVRTVKELEEVKKIISANNLYRSPTFKLWMMVEVPSNVILLDKFIEAGIDGISIDSDHLTMLMLGIDPDNSDVASAFDEQNLAVLWALERVIKTAQKHKITSSLCGKAASLYPDLLQKLVGWGITSVSVSPDAIEMTREHIARFENELLHKGKE